jgi:hypothetical protein
MSEETQEPEEEQEAEGWKEYWFLVGGVSKKAEEAIASVGGRVERLIVAHGNFSPALYAVVLLYDDQDDDQGFVWHTDDGKKARDLYICSADEHFDLYVYTVDGFPPRFETSADELRITTQGEWFAMEDGKAEQ